VTTGEETSFHGTPRFQVLKPLGAGGTGKVYAALDREAGCIVALKILRDTNPETLLRLKEEFRSVADIHHPNLVRLRELVEEKGRWFVSMDLIDGVDVLSYLRANAANAANAAALDEARLRDVLAQVFLGVAALHRAGKIHCDVTPSNVLVTSDGRAVLLDFGISRDSEQRLPREHGVTGTPEYMSPEQVLGEPLGPAADVYGVGAILYAALTGQPPFQGTVQEIFEAKVSRAPPRPSSRVPGLPADLDELCVVLLDGDPARRPTVEEALALLGRKAATTIAPPREVFVGRAGELAALDAALEDTRKGSPVIAVLQGDSGIGKTYLAREFIRRASRADPALLVLQGRCYEQESVPYKGIDGIVDDLTHVLSALPETEVEALLPDAVPLLRPLFPVIDRVPAVARATYEQLDVSPQARRREAVATLRELLTRVARRFHVVLQIEDFHWANADTLQLLFDLLSPAGAPGLLVLITQRASARTVKRSRGWETLPGDVRVLELGTFSPADTRELVERLMEGSADASSASQFLETISRDTSGHPLFIHELVVERGATKRAEIPVRLDDALAARVAGLPDESRAVVETVCLAALPLSRELLAASQEIEVGALALLLPSLRSHHLVRGSGARRADVIEPYHDRVRESVVRQMSVDRRREVHRWLARALDGQAEVPADALALHWEGAGEAARARDALVRAGDAASSAFAFDYAADLYVRALALAAGEGESRRSLLERLGDSLRNGGRGREASEAYDRAAVLASGSLALDLRRRAAEQLLTSGQFDEGRAAFRRVLDEEGIRITWAPWASVLLGILRRVWLLVRGLGYRERPESEVDPRLLREMEVLFDVLRGLSFLDATLLFDLTARLALLALRAGEPTRLGRFLCVEAMSAAAGGDLARGHQLLAVAEPLTTRAGDPHTLGVQVMGRALVDFYSNRWAPAIEGAAATTALFRQSRGGVAWESAVIQQFAMISMFRGGQLRRLRGAARESFDDAERRGDQFGMTSYGVGHPTLVHLVSDTPAEGREIVRAIMQRWTREAFLYQHYNAFLYEVTADLYEGDVAAAWGRIEATWRRMSRAGLLFFPEIAHEAFHLRGRAALARARELPPASSERAALVRTARSDARRLGGRRVPWPRGNGALLAAGIAAIDGDQAGAKAHLESAILRFEKETHMPLYVAAARRQLGALVGGDARGELEASADAALRAEGVARPERFAAALVGTFTGR
jgi:hypothetical protein